MDRILTRQPFPFLLRHTAAFLAVLFTSLLLRPFQPALAIQIAALIYLLPVMLSTVFLGLTPGILAAITAFLAFNYFHLPPYRTFQVHATQDLITLIIFLIVSVVMSQLIGQAREGTRAARQREWEATHLYELISTLAGLHSSAQIAGALADYALETFHARHAAVQINPSASEAAYAIHRPDQPPPADAAAATLPLKTARSQEGLLRLWLPAALSDEEARLLEASASQAALALERIRLARSVTRARVLEESDKLKSSLLNSVSHELRSPLAAIKASVSSLRSRAVNWDTAAREDLLATIEEETDHLNLLVGNLLDMSRIESGSLEPNRRWNAIGEIGKGVAAKMRVQLADHALEFDLPDDLPLAPTDYVMIEQVFTNLLSNSAKYAPAGSTIRVSAREEGEFVHVQVANQGPPVPEQHLERIFDKFHRVTAADRITGTGLGLSICKGIIEAHGGRIWAENRPGWFVFHFLLPLQLNGARPQSPHEAQDG